MAEKLHWKQHENAQTLLNHIYNEKKDNLTDAEIAERIQFMWYNIDTKNTKQFTLNQQNKYGKFTDNTER